MAYKVVWLKIKFKLIMTERLDENKILKGRVCTS